MVLEAPTGIQLTSVAAYSDSDLSLNQNNKPVGYQFPDGLIKFKITGLTPGATVQVTTTWPTSFPSWALYYKVDSSNGFYVFPDAVINGNTVVLTLTDGGAGDEDGTANGVIEDPGGVAVSNITGGGTTGGGTTGGGTTGTTGGGGGGGGGCFIETSAMEK